MSEAEKNVSIADTKREIDFICCHQRKNTYMILHHIYRLRQLAREDILGHQKI